MTREDLHSKVPSINPCFMHKQTEVMTCEVGIHCIINNFLPFVNTFCWDHWCSQLFTKMCRVMSYRAMQIRQGIQMICGQLESLMHCFFYTWSRRNRTRALIFSQRFNTPNLHILHVFIGNHFSSRLSPRWKILTV